MMEFTLCESDCPYTNGMLGFLAKQCYPSSPKRPHFAISIDLPDFFHELYMGGPSSKQGFCTAVQRFLQHKTTLDEMVHINLSDLPNARSQKTYTITFLMYIVPGKR